MVDDLTVSEKTLTLPTGQSRRFAAGGARSGASCGIAQLKPTPRVDGRHDASQRGTAIGKVADAAPDHASTTAR